MIIVLVLHITYNSRSGSEKTFYKTMTDVQYTCVHNMMMYNIMYIISCILSCMLMYMYRMYIQISQVKGIIIATKIHGKSKKI